MPVYAWWYWGVSGLSVVMLGSVVIWMFVVFLFSLLVAFHLVLSIGELVASASVDLLDYGRHS